MKNNYNFDVVKLHLKFNQRTQSTPHKFQIRFPSQNLILFQPDLCLERNNKKMKKILIIEDDTSISNELKDLLDNAGYSGVILKDFDNSLEEIKKENPDLILLDINIPKLNGEMLLQKIRKESNVPVIMVTSKNTEADEVLSISLGADDYITKPYNPTILLLRINNIFKRMENKNDVLTYNDLTIDPKKE